jgi:hypothetical protein
VLFLKIEFVYPIFCIFVQGVGIFSIHDNLFNDATRHNS